jgi:hypothetical protein
MSTPEQQEALDTFVGITGESEDHAKTFLGANNWDLQAATDLHFSSNKPNTQPHSFADIQRNEPKKQTEEWYTSIIIGMQVVRSRG